MPRFDLVIFDCDGVLVDSETLGNRVIARVATELGAAMTEAEALALFRGCKMAYCVAEIERRLGRAVPASFVSDLRARMADAFRLELRPIDGVAAALDAIDLPVCVASSGPREKILLTLGLTGLLPRFEGRIFSAYDVGSWKPDPGLFLHAAAAIGASPDRCAVIEDSVLGVRAGRAAGMTVFGFEAAHEPGTLQREGANIFRHMSELPTLLRQ